LHAQGQGTALEALQLSDLGAALGGESIRRALDLTSWEAAAERVRGWEASGTIGIVKIEIPTIREAVSKYLADVEARQLAPESVKKLRHTTEKLLLNYCSAEGLG
jgi:hypothetical protein